MSIPFYCPAQFVIYLLKKTPQLHFIITPKCCQCDFASAPIFALEKARVLFGLSLSTTKESKCRIEKIAINSIGMCDDCILISLEDDFLESEKERQLQEIEDH